MVPAFSYFMALTIFACIREECRLFVSELNQELELLPPLSDAFFAASSLFHGNE
jgi:hypothetical protein